MLLVTCYYKLYGSKNSDGMYIASLINFDKLTVNGQKILYTDAQTLSLLPILNNVTIKIVELQNLPFFSCIDAYRQDLSRDNIKGHTEYLYLLWNSKPFFVYDCLNNDSDCYYWFDIGMLRDGMSSTYNLCHRPNHAQIDMLQLYPFRPEDKECDIPTFRYGDVRVGGGCFGGSRAAWEQYYPKWVEVHQEYLDKGEFIGQDQRLMTTICLKYPDLINLIHPKPYDIIVDNKVKPGNPWFYMSHYLSDGEPFLYSKRYELIKCNEACSPTVSVVIPTYNRYELLLQTIASVKGQTYDDYEIIVVDDGSTEKEYSELSKHPDIDILIRVNKANRDTYMKGPAGPRNYGMQMARGQYIAILDDDDLWTKDKLQKQLAFMREENWKISGTNAWKFGQESGIYLPNKYKEFGGNYGQVLEQLFGTDYPVRITHKHMLCMNHLLTSSVMFHRSIIEDVGYFRHIQGGVEDYDYWLTISIWYDIGYLYEPMVMYRTGNAISYQKTQWVTQYFTYNIGRLLKWPDPVNVYPDEILDLSK